MKILFILGSYKPRASANGICASNIIEELKSQGNDVTILANKKIGCPKYEASDNITIYRIRPQLYWRLHDYSSAFAKTKPRRSKIISYFATFISKALLVITSPFWPIVSKNSNKRFRKKALELHEHKNFDVVISVFTPIETMLAGYELKKAYPNIVFIPYFLDSLSGGYGPKFFSKATITQRGLRIEKKIFDLADKIILMKSSEDHQMTYNSQYSDKMTFLDIPMLVKPANVFSKASCSDNAHKYKLLFVGSISRNIRNPKTLIEALLYIERDDIVCEFVGNIDCIEDFNPLKDRMGNRLSFSGFIDHDKLTKKISESDVLLNIGNLISTMVPSKIFEYMSYLKPIISTYDIENEPSAKYLINYPLALLISGSDTPQKNASLISNFLNINHILKTDYQTIENQFYLNTPEAFTREIDKLLRM